MLFLNPVKVVKGFTKVPQFLSALRADLGYLLSRDLPLSIQVPKREGFSDAAVHASTVASLVRQQRFAVVRQAVKKQGVRETLWPRFWLCYRLLGIFTVPFWCVVIVLHLACFVANPALMDWVNPFHWFGRVLHLLGELVALLPS